MGLARQIRPLGGKPMADSSPLRHSAASAVRPDYQEPTLRSGWERNERPERLTELVATDEADVGTLAAALAGIALVLIATAVMVIAFAF